MNPVRTRIKFCGITTVDDARNAVAAGADAIGLNFYPPSTRFVDMESAAVIAEAIPAFITITALFVDPEPAEVQAVIGRMRIDLLQFHGDEPDSFCRSFGKPYIKALKVRHEQDCQGLEEFHPEACGLLLDAWHPELHGGSGTAFDWRLIDRSSSRPLILAGGLTPANVEQAVATTHVYAVDVSSGIESAPGRKSADLMREFTAAVRRADSPR